MASTQELHTAIQNGQFALVKKLATNLKSQGIDIRHEIEFAKKLNKLRGGAFSMVVEAILSV